MPWGDRAHRIASRLRAHRARRNLATNRPGGEALHRVYSDVRPSFAKGEEWGHFEFGSTLIVLLEPGALSLDSAPVGRPLRLGERIGGAKS